MRKMIRGKYDSQWRFDWNMKTGKQTRTKHRGHFMTAVDYACWTRGGVKMIEHIRCQPWTTWRALDA